ncbi:HTH_Tnp_Tc3_2 domain-containing protein [Trichonephila clavipes]|nr:HTH_Tnp_Tc3_2 domain-containing protein [Trichonephila clavipes]
MAQQHMRVNANCDPPRERDLRLWGARADVPVISQSDAKPPVLSFQASMNYHTHLEEEYANNRKLPDGTESHPKVTTPNEEQYMAVTAKRNIRRTESEMSRQLSSDTDTTVSRQTVYRRLGHIDLYDRMPVRCVPLTATHCRLRLTWSREHALLTPQQWSCVMFSDESRFSLQSGFRRTLIWREPSTRYHQENTINDTVTVGQDGSFGEELFLVPELTCMFRV